MDVSVNNKRLKIMANIVPKVDVLGPELQYVPKKIEINKPMPDLKFVTPKVDNEGLQIVHLPKEVKVNKGLLKFDKLRTRIDNKGIDILRGPSSPRKDPSNQGENFESLEQEEIIQEEPESTAVVKSPLHEAPDEVEDDHPPASDHEQSDNDNVFLPEVTLQPQTLSALPLMSPLALSSRTATPSSSSSSDVSLPATPVSKNSFQRLFSLGSRRPSHQISPRSHGEVTPRRPSTVAKEDIERRPSPVIKNMSPSPRPPPSPPKPTPSPKAKLPTPPESPEIILHFNTSPPVKIPSPTPPPSKLIQVSPVRNQDFIVQTDTVSTLDMFNQTEEFGEPKKEGGGWKWWQYLLAVLLLLIVFIGIGLAIGYAVGWFGKSKLTCNAGFVKVGNLCHAETTTSPSTTATATTTTQAPCDGCNCPLDVTLDPGNNTGNSLVITSPRYPNKYRHNSDCTWNIFATSGQLQLTFTQFNLEWAENCRQKDFVFLDQVQRYGRMWLCGPYLPSNFLTQTSKFSRLGVRFRSNDAVTRFGFRAVITATGTVSDVKDIVNEGDKVVDEIKELINFGDSQDNEDTTEEALVDNSSLQRQHRGGF